MWPQIIDKLFFGKQLLKQCRLIDLSIGTAHYPANLPPLLGAKKALSCADS